MRPLPLAWGACAAALLLAPAVLETLRSPGERAAWRSSLPVVSAQDAARGALGGWVVFLDVREPEEYAEQHLPGARALPLRDLASADLPALRKAGLVVPYCRKDLRGFEAVRRLRRLGLTNVAVLEGFGLHAWEAAGLPEAGSRPGLDDPAALRALRERVPTLGGLGGSR